MATDQLAQHRRFDTHYARAFELVHSGYVDKVRLITSTLRDPRELMPNFLSTYIDSCGGNLIVDYTIHDIDSCLHVLKERPTTVYAVGHAHDELVPIHLNQVHTFFLCSCGARVIGTR